MPFAIYRAVPIIEPNGGIERIVGKPIVFDVLDTENDAEDAILDLGFEETGDEPALLKDGGHTRIWTDATFVYWIDEQE